jgi:hypothetical protein
VPTSTAPTRVTTTDRRASPDDMTLTRAATLFAAAVIVHNSDHLRRGATNAHHDVLVVGTASIAVEIAVVILVFQHHRLAPIASVIAGTFLALGYLEVHFLPAHAFLSDPLTDIAHRSALSIMAASLELTAAVILAIAAIGVMRRRGGLASPWTPHAQQLSVSAALRHPVPCVLVTVHAVGAVVTLAQILHA